MKAWQYTTVTGKLEDCLSLKDDVAVPATSSLGKGEVIVEVISAAINPLDYKMAESSILGRLMVPRPATPGIDFCGRVVDVHPTVSDLQAGQLIFGGLPMVRPRGTLAQYTVVLRDHCVPLPPGVEPDHAAAVGTAATSAYQSLAQIDGNKDSSSSSNSGSGRPRTGARVFINGGSGGVGTWSIQIAKALGYEAIITTCSAAHVDLCKKLGADKVLDYKATDVVAYLQEQRHTFDLVIDNVGSDSAALYAASRQALRVPDGSFVQVGVGHAMTLSGIAATYQRRLWGHAFGAPRYRFVDMSNASEYLSPIAEWMLQGKVHAVIDSSFAFEEARAAFARLREGHCTGKVVIHVAGRPTGQEQAYRGDPTGVQGLAMQALP
jgi:NADPH:quinone reductase-like Zn-dependent oxidoreductase